LRIREDTAKYLRNLDLSSAHYDPKTRSMRENPTPADDPSMQFALQFQGDNVTRKTGETLGFERLNQHAFDAYQKGQEIHMQAAPSQAELLYKQFKDKKEKLSGVTKASILEKYGNAAADTPAPEGLLLGQTEGYVEYDRAGRVVKGHEKPALSHGTRRMCTNRTIPNAGARSGELAQWGYACCGSFQKNSYCTGKKGLDAAAASATLMKDNLAAREAQMEAQKKEEEEAAARDAA
jgi:pre-mRNA-processing factor SLU7